MAEINWSKEQLAAINIKDGNILVSASAGSGKTAVLTQRVFQLLIDGCKLNELLVLTFSNFAAKEMRDRIRNILLEKGYSKIAASVDAVNIQTYDAFALSIVKKYYRLLGFPSDVKVVDQKLLELEKKMLLRGILDRRYANNDVKTIDLINKCCFKNDDSITSLILDFYEKADLKMDKSAYLNTYLENVYGEAAIKTKIDETVKSILKKISNSISTAKSLNNVTFAEEIMTYYSFYENCHSYDDLVSVGLKNPNLKYPTFKSSYKEDVSAQEAARAKEGYKVLHSMLTFDSEKEIIDFELSLKPYISTIIDITKELDGDLMSFKNEHAAYSFQDIFKMAMQLTKIPKVSEKLKHQFKYIMIDEYQDTSDLQEEMINMIANNNVYCVGDVKQSIYKFRNANFELFQNKFDRYMAHNGGILLSLPDNFRSRKEVIDGNNKLFMALMSKEDTGLDYKKDHMMLFGSKSYELVKCKTQNYHHELLNYEKGKDSRYSLAETEARLIASDIVRRINSKMQIASKRGLRDANFSDFAILTPTKSDYKIFQRVFNEYNIPLFANYNQILADNNFTLVLKSIIKIISLKLNNQIDKEYTHCFISIMRSFLCDYTDEEVEDAVLMKNFSKFAIEAKIDNLAEFSKNSSLEELTNEIIRSFNVYERIVLLGDVSNCIELLHYFIDLAKQMDEMNYSVNEYAMYFQMLDAFNIEQDFEETKPSVDSVQLMSIHASKGLQFEVVYFGGLYKGFVGNNKTVFKFNDKYGIMLKNLDFKAKESFFLKPLKQANSQSELNERLRLFYVDLTRAKEKAIILNCANHKSSTVNSLSDCTSFLDFIRLSEVGFESYDGVIENIRPIIVSASSSKAEVQIHDGYNFSDKTKQIVHISKEICEDNVSQEALKVGTKLHYYLEQVDFATKDVSFIIDERDRQIIEKFLTIPLFKDSANAKVAHEYAFYDKINDVNGVIDLLLIYEDHIDIVDYKLSHVDDEAYVRQVNAYREYIQTIEPNKPIYTHIVSILNGKENPNH